MIASVFKQIEKINIDSDKPLVLIDADEVLVHFAIPFENYLRKQGFKLELNGYTLHDAIIDAESNLPINSLMAQELVVNFIKEETHRQPPTKGAIDSVHNISEFAQIIIISNVPQYAHEARLKNFQELNLPFPFVSNEGPKGPALKQICDQVKKPAVFIDDNASQVASAKKFVPNLYRFYFSGCDFVRAHMPITDVYTHNPKSWKEIEDLCNKLLL